VTNGDDSPNRHRRFGLDDDETTPTMAALERGDTLVMVASSPASLTQSGRVVVRVTFPGHANNAAASLEAEASVYCALLSGFRVGTRPYPSPLGWSNSTAFR